MKQRVERKHFFKTVSSIIYVLDPGNHWEELNS